MSEFTLPEPILTLLVRRSFAVVGASRRKDKYGYLVYKALKAAGRRVYAVNPQANRVDGDPCWPSLTDLPQVPEVAVMVVPPAVTEQAVGECARLGTGGVWMQPGAESDAAIAACQEANIAVVAGGPCIMVLLRTRYFYTR